MLYFLPLFFFPCSVLLAITFECAIPQYWLANCVEIHSWKKKKKKKCEIMYNFYEQPFKIELNCLNYSKLEIGIHFFVEIQKEKKRALIFIWKMTESNRAKRRKKKRSHSI